MPIMAKLFFNYSTMNAGKSTVLLQASHNYREHGMNTYLLTAQVDGRAGAGRISSRIGIGSEADTFADNDNLFAMIKARMDVEPVACIFVDEAQFLQNEQVWQLARVVDDLGVPVLCYGLRVDFRGELFPGSAALLAIADEMRNDPKTLKTAPHTMPVKRMDEVTASRKPNVRWRPPTNET